MNTWPTDQRDTAAMARRDKVRDALWRYAPERTEKIVTASLIAGAAVMGIANWLRKGRP